MKFNKITAALCCAAGISASVSAADLTIESRKLDNALEAKTELSFADWMAEKNRAKYANTTDQIIVTMSNNGYVNALKMGAETSFTTDKGAQNFDGKGSPADSASQILMDLTLRAGTPLEFVETFQSDKVILKLSKEFQLSEVEQISARLVASNFASSAEADPKRWPMAQNTPFGYTDVQASQLSDSASGSLGVCIIDSGYDRAHPDLSGNNHSGTNDSGTGNWYQAGGSHGTHVAGTIAALDNNEGILGVLPNGNLDLHIIKVFTAAGWAYSSSLVNAISDCQAAGSKVVNMSLGGSGSSNSERNSMQSFLDNGMLLIAAAGNDGDSSLSYPASYDAVMSVAAVDENGQHAEFSQFTSQVEIAGPGEAILSTVERGDGRQGFITVGGVQTGDDRVNPQTRFVNQGGSFNVVDVNGTVSGDLASCSLSGSTYNCGNMSGKICIVERSGNQGDSGNTYPEIDATKACADAGAAGVIVYSNSTRPGLQNPFHVDENADVTVPTVSVNRSTGQSLLGSVGQSATLEVRSGTDYAYYNGTSMATPHVAGAAALAWSNNLSCTAAEVRAALTATALDLDVSGRDNRTGWGMVQAKAASDYMAANCGSGSGGGGGGSGSNELTNGAAVTGLAASTGSELEYTLEVPAGATDLSFAMSGGSGDADLYVRYGAAPTTSTYDCRPYATGNNETCDIADNDVQGGTYYVMVRAYSTFSGVSLTGSFTEPSNGGGGSGATPVSGSASNLSAARREWVYFDPITLSGGYSNLTVTMSGGSGDADLYLREGAQPTTSSYACRPYESGNNEVCDITSNVDGDWYIGIRAYRAFSGVSITYTAN